MSQKKVKVQYTVEDEIVKEMKRQGIDAHKEILEGIKKHFDDHNEECEITEVKGE